MCHKTRGWHSCVIIISEISLSEISGRRRKGRKREWEKERKKERKNIAVCLAIVFNWRRRTLLFHVVWDWDLFVLGMSVGVNVMANFVRIKELFLCRFHTLRSVHVKKVGLWTFFFHLQSFQCWKFSLSHSCFVFTIRRWINESKKYLFCHFYYVNSSIFSFFGLMNFKKYRFFNQKFPLWKFAYLQFPKVKAFFKFS